MSQYGPKNKAAKRTANATGPSRGIPAIAAAARAPAPAVCVRAAPIVTTPLWLLPCPETHDGQIRSFSKPVPVNEGLFGSFRSAPRRKAQMLSQNSPLFYGAPVSFVGILNGARACFALP